MTATYLLDGTPIDPDSPGARGRLAAAHAKHLRPLCPCRRPPIPMYLAKVGESIIIKRMPGTGATHAPDCSSYEPPAELSGLGEVVGRAIKEDPDTGETTLNLAFSMSKGANRAAPVPSDGETTTVKSDGTKLTLRSLLHYLWDEAGFNRWTPAMEGRRSYRTVRKFLLHAAGDKKAKRAPLADNLFIPEPWSKPEADAIADRARREFKAIAGVRNGSRKLKIVVAEVKEFSDARYGKKVIFKNLPSQPFYMDEKFAGKLEKAFANEIDMWLADDDGHLMMVGTFSVSEAGVPQLEEAALMAVNANWIPYETQEDKLLLERLHEAQRRFVKGLRFNLPNAKPLATVVTNDTTPKPVAMYLVPAEADDAHMDALAQLVEESALASWFWRVEESMPELPACEDYRPHHLAHDVLEADPEMAGIDSSS